MELLEILTQEISENLVNDNCCIPRDLISSDDSTPDFVKTKLLYYHGQQDYDTQIFFEND